MIDNIIATIPGYFEITDNIFEITFRNGEIRFVYVHGNSLFTLISFLEENGFTSNDVVKIKRLLTRRIFKSYD